MGTITLKLKPCALSRVHHDTWYLAVGTRPRRVMAEGTAAEEVENYQKKRKKKKKKRSDNKYYSFISCGNKFLIIASLGCFSTMSMRGRYLGGQVPALLGATGATLIGHAATTPKIPAAPPILSIFDDNTLRRDPTRTRQNRCSSSFSALPRRVNLCFQLLIICFSLCNTARRITSTNRTQRVPPEL